MEQQQRFKMTIDNGDDHDDDGGFANLLAGRTRRQLPQLGPEKYGALRRSRRPLQLGNKDLIVRMLAEIFQVRQDSSGQIRWQQMSSSLVPISLYSRATSKWLDYLLAASSSVQATDPASSMSPDSRDFLLLLQQFHQQTASATIQVEPQQRQHNESIVFQVVGHDFLGGQCKKVLNVKIRQPGTRLGQASNYFVYWREQQLTGPSLGHRLHHQHFSASSFASTSSQPTGAQLKATQTLNQAASTMSRLPADDQQTWGLNFASINDAKLFYDICSLNLVDLDFNSEYLKQLSDTQYGLQHGQIASAMSHCIPMATNSPLYPTNKRNSNSRFKQQAQQQLAEQQRLLSKQQGQQFQLRDQRQQTGKMSSRGQSSLSKCQACRRTQEQKQLSANEAGSCPIHGVETLRERSRSTTRQSSKWAREEAHNLRRSRSFSTPASPQLDHCLVHGPGRRADTECEHQTIDEAHQRQANKRQQRRQLEQQQQQRELDWSNKMSGPNSADCGPQKPARGFLRMMPSRESQENLPPPGQKRQKVPQTWSLGSSRSMRNMAHAPDSGALQPNGDNTQATQLALGSVNNKSIALDHFLAAGADFQQATRTLQETRRQLMQQNIATNRSLFQRPLVGTETFDTIARRDARLARARYANSKNMKDFLSLDAAGLGHSTPTQQQQQRFKRPQTKPLKSAANNKQPNERSSSLTNGTKQDSLEQHEQRHSAARPSSGNDKKQQQQTDSKQSIQMGATPNSTGGALGRAHARPPKVQSNCVGLANDIRCSVSTTTDDLPMDSSTRRRMLKLTSEEVISERTEPKSACSTSTPLERSAQQEVGGEPVARLAAATEAGRDERLERKVRAVSLGPEFGGRGRGGRSDGSRRRSLERSVRVDLDSSPLPASSFGKGARLSPLAQSGASPQEAAAATAADPSSENSPSFPASPQAAELEPAQFMSDGGPAAAANTIEAGPHSGAQAYAPQVAQLHYQLQHQLAHVHEGALSGGGARLARFAQEPTQFESNLYQCDQAACAFKSAPDIRAGHLSARMDIGLANGAHNQPLAADQNNFELMTQAAAPQSGQSSHRFGLQPPSGLLGDSNASRRRSNLSSYAVPLCTAVKRPPQQQQQHHHQTWRQCQSCPSSLRRKRRLLAPQNLSNNLESAHFQADCSNSNTFSASRQPYCSCLNCRQASMTACALSQASWMADNQCGCVCAAQMSGPSFNNCQLAHGSLASASQLHWPSVRQQHPIPHQRLHCHHNLAPFHSGYSRQVVPSDAYQQQQQQLNYSSRSHSSQSNRSTAVHYGLYESDCDDDDDDEANVENDGPLLAGHNLASQLNGGPDEELFSRPHSAHFGPATIKPVLGYDQTLARATLKSRQRSRSQPPRASAEANNSFHLTKSMENVEKLIKEVQNELRALKRQPLGTAHIDLRSGPAATGHGHRREATPAKVGSSSAATASGEYGNGTAAKMSLEESESGEQQHQADGKFSHSSATRRAGQFKCVGAIRKAGFLAVKKWIIKRRQSIELARKQGWKRYWVCLRGTALLFHSLVEKRNDEPNCEQLPNSNQIDLLTWIQTNCSSQVNLVANLLANEQEAGPESRDALFKSMAQCYIEREPRHLIIIDGAIAQPIPEHPRRDFVFCLSTTFGDAYLFQASCQLESDNWISAMHNACAASIARDLTRDYAIKLFESKMRNLELEAEKKFFLRQRLESRLTSMSAMCHSSGLGAESDRYANTSELSQDKGKLTMRNLLQQLHQQLLALDTYIEQLHCEVYQLRCYLSSCGLQSSFKQSVQQRQQQETTTTTDAIVISNELPHPKSLLMHVSKPTKLLLIKLGIFTVSSFHALIHARQDSAKSILQQIECNTNETEPHCLTSKWPLELRIRSHSISETLLSKRENAKLESETEDLLEIANLKRVTVCVDKSLVSKIKQQEDESQLVQVISDDRCSIQHLADTICLNLKVNSSSTSSSIVRQALKVLEPNLGQFDFLNYYLRLVVLSEDGVDLEAKSGEAHGFHVIKRKETVADWTNYSHLELMEKMVFRVELTRSCTDELASMPFGISVEGQLFSANSENVLNVYCNYIEWASAADKAGLQDEDELLLLNGIPLADLDLMFVECLLQEANKLRAVVRSSRLECSKRGQRLDLSTWRSLDDNGDGNGNGEHHETGNKHRDILRDITNQNVATSRAFESAGSQVISDEYLTSLVCPPPPAKSSGLLRADCRMLRQKSDTAIGASLCRLEGSMSKCRSQHQMELSLESEPPIDLHIRAGQLEAQADKLGPDVASSADLAKQLIQKTERLSRLLGHHSAANLDQLSPNAHLSTSSIGSRVEQSDCERLRRSILELIETEYAYIKHLETICDNYMSPLEENDFLNSADLRSFKQVVLDILCLQHDFFHRLCSSIGAACGLDMNELASDQCERLNRIVQQTDTLKTTAAFKPIVESIGRLFESEADRFKLYASYCVSYSKLQTILHPNKPSSCIKLAGSSINSIPSALNTFSSSLHSSSLGSLGPFHGHQRDSRLINLNELSESADQGALLKRLSELLANLDSSSSSASLSLAKSSGAEPAQSSKVNSFKSTPSEANGTGQGSGSMSNNSSASTQKNVHQQNFESYLIKPIQRLVKYPLLLNSIALALEAHEGGALAGATCSSLKAAILQMESVANHVNNAQRVHDQYGAIFDRIEAQFFAQQAFEGARNNNLASLFGPHQPPISVKMAQLLHWGPVGWLNVAEFSSKVRKQQVLSSVCFVFESCVVFICKELVKATTKRPKQHARLKVHHQEGTTACSSSRSFICATPSEAAQVVRYHTLIPVSEVQVRAVAQERQVNPSAGFEWELFQCSSWGSNSGLLSKSSAGKRESSSRAPRAPGRRYLLLSESNEERNVFLRKIRLTIRESVRKMSLPLGRRSPSSKSFELKKLSTSSATSVNSNTNAHSSLSQATSLSPAEQEEAREAASVPGIGSSGCNARFENVIRVNS